MSFHRFLSHAVIVFFGVTIIADSYAQVTTPFETFSQMSELWYRSETDFGEVREFDYSPTKT